MKNIIRAISTIFIYLFFMFSGFLGVILSLVGIEVNSLSNMTINFYSIIYSIFLMIIILFTNRKQIVVHWGRFKNNHLSLFKENFKTFILAYILVIVCNLAILLIFKKTAPNQNNLLEMAASSPIYIIFSAVIFAPIIEELVFRLSFKEIISNRVLFILLSGLIFGFFHLLVDFSIANLIFIFPYSIMGIALAYILEKSNNIFTTIGFHFLNNGIAMAILVIGLVFG